MRIEAIKSFPYGGKRWRTGDIDEVRNDHARVLIATRKAKRAPYAAQPVAVAPTEIRAELTAEQAADFLEAWPKNPERVEPFSVSVEPEAEAPKKRTYKRRDLTAEE